MSSNAEHEGPCGGGCAEGGAGDGQGEEVIRSRLGQQGVGGHARRALLGARNLFCYKHAGWTSSGAHTRRTERCDVGPRSQPSSADL